MTTGLISHPECLDHLPPGGHPESPARLRAVLTALERESFQDLVRIDAPRVAKSDLLRAHDAEFVDLMMGPVAAAAAERCVQLDPDTAMSAGSLNAALRAAGSVIAAVEEVHAGRLR